AKRRLRQRNGRHWGRHRTKKRTTCPAQANRRSWQRLARLLSHRAAPEENDPQQPSCPHRQSRQARRPPLPVRATTCTILQIAVGPANRAPEGECERIGLAAFSAAWDHLAVAAELIIVAYSVLRTGGCCLAACGFQHRSVMFPIE